MSCHDSGQSQDDSSARRPGSRRIQIDSSRTVKYCLSFRREMRSQRDVGAKLQPLCGRARRRVDARATGPCGARGWGPLGPEPERSSRSHRLESQVGGHRSRRRTASRSAAWNSRRGEPDQRVHPQAASRPPLGDASAPAFVGRGYRTRLRPRSGGDPLPRTLRCSGAGCGAVRISGSSSGAGGMPPPETVDSI